MAVYFETSFIDTVKNRLNISDVVGGRVQLRRNGTSLKGLCPFHKEKTPSFHVRDDKGYYHCFGCGAHGNIFDFLMKLDNLNFPQALEKAASMASIPLPRPDPVAQKLHTQKQARTQPLKNVLRSVSTLYTQMLKKNKNLLDYIENRHLLSTTVEAFSLGYAASSLDGLMNVIDDCGLQEKHLIEAGLLGRDTETKRLYPRFRDRLMFPIHDLKGSVVGFGGRILKNDKQPKYLNSPDSEIFHKGQILYGLWHVKQGWPHARNQEIFSQSHTTNNLIIVEGYMDVLALQQQGFNAVAPLGTALTEEQILLAWQQNSNPILCFDGDTAGHNAAMRSIERALPLLKPGYSLRFAVLPEGEDPDSLMADGKKHKFEKLIAAPIPLVDMWWKKITQSNTYHTPEEKAHLKQYIYRQLSAIKNEPVREAYSQDFKQRLYKLFMSHTTVKRKSKNNHSEPTRNYYLQSVPTDIQTHILLAGLINHPQLTESLEHEAMNIPIQSSLKKFHQVLLDKIFQDSSIESESLSSYMKEKGFDKVLEKLSNSEVYDVAPFVHPKTPLDDAAKGWLELWKIYAEAKGLDEEIEQLAQELLKDPTPTAYERMRALTTLRRAQREQKY